MAKIRCSETQVAKGSLGQSQGSVRGRVYQDWKGLTNEAWLGSLPSYVISGKL